MLNRNSQVAAKLEGTEGVAEVLAAADFRSNAKDHSHGYEPSEYERGITRGTLTPLPTLKGARMARVGFVEELVGGGKSAAAPWHTDLQCMGFLSVALKMVNIGAFSGGSGWVEGQLLGNNAAFGSATKVVRFVKTLAGTPDKVVYMPVSGSALADTETLYNYDTPQVSAAVDSAPDDAGFGFRPLTESDSAGTKTATVRRWLGGELHDIIGARAAGSLMLNANQPGLLTVNYRGCPVLHATTHRPLTGNAVTIPAVGVTPKMCLGMPLKLGDYEPPVLTRCEIDFGITLADRPTMTDKHIASSGNMPPRIGGRQIRAALDPEYVINSTFDIVGRANTGETFLARTEIGDVTHGNGLLIVHAPQAQITGNIEPGDREGITTQDLSLLLCGSQDDELFLWHVFVPVP
jgi:hypothetical protein